MRGRRVISLLLSLVMALSLCSGVWATGEVGGDPAPAEKTQSDEGVIVNYAERTIRFYPVMDGGYLKYDPNDPNELKIDSNNIDYTVGADTTTIPAFFIRKTGDFSSAHLFLAIDKKDGETTVPTLPSSANWLTLQNENSNDGGKFVYKLSVTGDRSKGDTAFITLEGQTTPFAIVFEENNGGEGNEPQIQPLTDFMGVLADNEERKSKDNPSKLTDAQKKAASDYVDKYLLNSNGYVKNGNSDTTGISVKNGEDVYNATEVAAIKAAVKAFREAEWQVHDALGNVQGVQIENGWRDCFGRYLAELAGRVGISLWGDYPPNNGVAMTVGSYELEYFSDSAYSILSYNPALNVTPDAVNKIYSVPWSEAMFFITVTCDSNTAPGLTIVKDSDDHKMVVFSDGSWQEGGKYVYRYRMESSSWGRSEGELTFRIGNNDSDTFTVKFVAPNDSGNQFAGMKAALEASNTAALAYVDQYLVDSTGHVKFGTGELDIRNSENAYSDAEVAAAKAAIMAFRDINWEQRDPLANVRGVQIEGEWTDCFGCYLAELASRVGISLWGDYPSRNGVDMTLSNGKTISFYTDCAYGVPARDENVAVTADANSKRFTIPYTQTYYCFTIPAGSGKVTSLTVKDATSTELKNDNNEVIGYSCQPFQNSNINVETRCDGWFGDDSNKTYLFSVQVSYDREAYDLPLVITYNDNTTAEFNVKAVDPNPWNPNDTVNANNATGALKGLYENGFKAPAYGTNFHLRFPDQLHEYNATKAADYAAGTDHWDYKWNYDANTGIVTVEVNADHEDCWKNCVKYNTDIFTDGVYFDYWIGGSGESKPAAYGIHLNFNPEGETPDYRNDILTGDYEHSNGWKMAVVNQRSTTNTVLTFKEGTVSYGEVVAMSNNEANNEQPVSNAEYKYALQFNVVTNATKAIKLDTEETQDVPKNRITSFTPVTGVDGNKWTCNVPEDGTAFVLYKDGDYTAASTETKAYGNLVLTNLVGTLGFIVPNGYTTLNYVIDDHSGNYINSGNNGVNPLSVTAGNEVRFPVFKARYTSIKLIWSNDAAGKTLTESLLVEMGSATPWMGLLGDTTTPAAPANTIMNGQTSTFLQDNGVNVTYDPELGYFSTSVDASKLTDLSALNYTVALTPMENAAYFKLYDFGGSESPFVHGEERKTQVAAWFTGVDPVPLAEGDVNDVAALSLIQIDNLTVNGLTVYFSATQLFSGVAIQWLDANQQVLGYSYVYGRNGDFVTSVETQTKPEVTAPVDKPTLEGFDTDPGFTCDKNPQSGGDGSKVFFQFSVKNKDGISKEHKAVIYLPYEYFGIDAAEGMRRAARGDQPVIYHYFDESCSETNREVIHGEYTPYGVKFETGSFSPFVVDCSTTSAPSRYHLTTAAKADSPETFDGGIALYGALAVTSLTGMAYVGKKRED